MNHERVWLGCLSMMAVCVLLLPTSARAQVITISVSSSPAGVVLAGSGTGTVSFSAGTVSRSGGNHPIGITRRSTASDWTLSASFDVLVTKDAALASSSYTLEALLSTADGRTWAIDSAPINASSASTISLGGIYAAPAAHTLDITIPDNTAGGAFYNTISLIAVAN